MKKHYIIGRESTKSGHPAAIKTANPSKVAAYDCDSRTSPTSTHMMYDTLEEAVEKASLRAASDREVWVVYEAIRTIRPRLDVQVDTLE